LRLEGSFTRIAAILPRADGSIVVADDRNLEIHVFGRDGSHAGRIGRTGRGPGEFESLTAVGTVADTLWVFDGAQLRTSFYGLAGEALATIRSNRGWLAAVTSAGALGRQLGAGVAEAREEQLPLVLMTRDGIPIDTVAWVPSKHRGLFLGPRPDGAYTIGAQHFNDAGITVAAPGGGLVFIVDRRVAEIPDDAAFGVVALSANGDTVWSRRYRYVPRRVERERADSVWNALYPGLSRAGHSDAEIRGALFIPDHYPPVSSAFAGLDGSLWLRRQPSGPTVEYRVIGPAGDVIAALSLPAGITLKAAGEHHVWGVETNELDVPTIVRLRIQKRP
jgi:hypothetical protein